ncbi:MAG: hypothetical protein CMO80_15560 [Verrucomicrobiales bacterium]|nr:hypothetical protein [Verrucomicrobiales bacterium]
MNNAHFGTRSPLATTPLDAHQSSGFTAGTHSQYVDKKENRSVRPLGWIEIWQIGWMDAKRARGKDHHLSRVEHA